MTNPSWKLLKCDSISCCVHAWNKGSWILSKTEILFEFSSFIFLLSTSIKTEGPRNISSHQNKCFPGCCAKHIYFDVVPWITRASILSFGLLLHWWKQSCHFYSFSLRERERSVWVLYKFFRHIHFVSFISLHSLVWESSHKKVLFWFLLNIVGLPKDSWANAKIPLCSEWTLGQCLC